MWNGVLVFSLAMVPVALAGPGFSTISRKHISLEIRKPGQIRLANTSVAFSGNVTNPQYQPVLASLLTTLATEIVKNEKTLVVKATPKEAEWTLFMNVTGYSAPNPKSETQRIGNATTVMKHWSGSLRVAYRVLDRKGVVHDAGNISSSYEKATPEGGSKGGHVLTGWIDKVPGRSKSVEPVPVTAEDLKQILISKASDEISSKLGNTSMKLDVKVATGEDHLNRAATLMEQKLWARALQEIESAEAFSKAEEESYRLYDLGLIHEAMSYEARSYKEQRTNLFQAQSYYDKAMESNRKEKYFVQTVARLRDSIARYKTLDDQQKLDGKPTSAPAAPKSAARSGGIPAGGQKTNTAADIIRLYKAGIARDQILEIIQSAPLDFNPVDVQTVLAIKDANLPIDVQNEMRKKVGVAPLKPVSRPTIPPPPAKKQGVK